MRTGTIHWPTYLGIGALLITPFVSTEGSLDLVMLPRLIFMSVAVVLLSISLWLTSRKSDEPLPVFPGRTLAYALFGYLAFVALSISPAHLPSEAWLETAKVGMFVSLVIVFTMTLQRDRSAFGLFARGLTVLAVCLATIGLCQYYGIAFEGFVRSGGLANRNLLASALCLLLPFALYVNFQGGVFWSRFALGAVAPIIAMVMLTNSRGIWFALTFTTIVLIGAWWVLSRNPQLSRRQKSKWKRQAAKSILLATVTVVIFSMPSFRHVEQQSVMGRAMTATSFKQGSVAERFAMWSNSLAMFSDHPILGFGAGNWKLIGPGYGPISERQLIYNTMFQRPHNDYLWVLSESGIFALLFYLAILAAALVYALRILHTATPSDDVAISFTMLFGLVLFMSISFFSYPKERIIHTMLISLMLASILSILRAKTTGTRSRQFQLRRILLIAAIVIVLPACAIGWFRLQSESHIIAALRARNRADWPVVVQEIDQASSRWIQIDHTGTPLAWYRGIANFSMERTEEAFRDFTDAYRVHPNHHHVLNNLGSCYEFRQMHDSAIFYYRRALEITPGFEDAAINLAAAFYNDGRYEEALESLNGLTTPVADPRFESYMDRIKSKLAEGLPD